jgi:hypothetical protein
MPRKPAQSGHLVNVFGTTSNARPLIRLGFPAWLPLFERFKEGTGKLCGQGGARYSSLSLPTPGTGTKNSLCRKKLVALEVQPAHSFVELCCFLIKAPPL